MLSCLFLALPLSLPPAAPPPPRTARPAPFALAIDRILDQPAFDPAVWGIEVRDLTTGRVLYERNARKNLTPASTLKLFATAAALDALGPDARFETTLEAAGALDSYGRLAGDLYLVGRGDPGLAERGGDGRDGLDALAEGLWSAGVRLVDGRLVGDDAVFTGERRGPGWEWGDLVWCYGAEVSGLSWNGSCADIVASPGAAEGAPLLVTRHPVSGYYEVLSSATTSAPGSKSDLTLVRELGSARVQLSGTYPAGAEPHVMSVALEDPSLYAATVLSERLGARGIRVSGVSALAGQPPPSARILASHESEPVSKILEETNKPSDNLRAEALLRLLGLKVKGEGTVEGGRGAVEDFAKRMGVDIARADFEDASGMAAADLVEPHQLVELLAAMDRHPYARSFEASLPVAGKDGTLEHRMRGTAAGGRIRAKTGTRHHVSSLAGYATTASGRRLAFAIVVNGHSLQSHEAASAIDAICEILVGL